MTMTTGSLACLPRFSTPRNHDRPTLGPQIYEISKRLGTPLMPWQRLVVDVAFEVDPATGLLWYDEVDVTVPRQSGKTTLVNSVTTHRATVMATKMRRRQVMAYTAQSGIAARTKLEREFAEALRQSTAFAEVKNVKARPQSARQWMLRMNSGDEHILYGRLKSILMCKPPTPKAGHGDVLDLGIIDEAFSREDDAVEQAMQPAMLTRPSAQLWVVSTAGDHNESQNIRSFYLWDKVSAGRSRSDSGVASKTAYFEWSAEDEADPSDEDVWRSCSPALGHTITIEALRARWVKALESPDPEAVNSFRRAYLNQWPRIPQRPDDGRLRLSAEEWRSCGDPRSVVGGAPCLVVDAAPDLASATVAVGSMRADGRRHLELVAHDAGTGWVAGFVGDVWEADRPSVVAVVSGSPAVALVEPLEARGVTVRKVVAAEFAAACGGFVAGVRERAVAHRIPTEYQAAVHSALAGAVRKPAGDGGFTWSRRSSAVDISPLVALTVAWHLAGVPVEAPADRPVFAY